MTVLSLTWESPYIWKMVFILRLGCNIRGLTCIRVVLTIELIHLRKQVPELGHLCIICMDLSHRNAYQRLPIQCSWQILAACKLERARRFYSAYNIAMIPILKQFWLLLSKAPNYYRNHCWAIINCVMWHSTESNFAGSAHELDWWHVFRYWTF